MAPAWTAGNRGTLWALAVVLGCALWNLRGAKAVGGGSVWLFGVMLSPFVVLVAVGLWRGLAGHAAGGGLHALAGWYGDAGYGGGDLGVPVELHGLG